MRIWMQACNDQRRDGVDPDATECDLSECFPDDPEELARVQAEIEANGLAYVGGGAAQLFLLTAVDAGDSPPYQERDDVDDGDYIAERVAERDDIPPSPYE